MIELLAPEPRTELTGGYRFNRRVADLLGSRLDYRLGDRTVSARGGPRVIDSLWLAPGFTLPRTGPRDLLLAHSLPSLDQSLTHAEAATQILDERDRIPRFRGAIAPSGFMAGVLASRGLARDRVRIVAPGVDASLPPRRRPLVRPEDAVRVITVGAWHPGKGHDLLPALMETCRDLAWHWTFLGADMAAGYRDGVLRDLVRRGLGDRINLVESLAPTQALCSLAASDLFVLPTRMESYGMAIREAVSMGTPALVGDCGGVREALAGGGVALAVDDTEAWEQALYRALADRAWLAQLGERAAAAPPAPGWGTVAEAFAVAAQELAR